MAVDTQCVHPSHTPPHHITSPRPTPPCSLLLHGGSPAGGHVESRRAAPIPHEESTENPGHPPGHTGLWKLVDPGTSGPNRTAGLMMATDEKMGIIAFGGAGPATGGNHPGKYTNQTWRWKC